MKRTKLLKRRKSNRLFYDQYVYKLHFCHKSSVLYRVNIIGTARDKLETLRELLSNDIKGTLDIPSRRLFGVPSRIESEQEIDQAHTILDYLESRKDYKLRIEYPFMSVFSNDREWLEEMIDKAGIQAELWAPPRNTIPVLLENPDITVVASRPEFQLKVWVRSQAGVVPSSFVEWAEKNTDKVKVTATKLYYRTYLKSGYFYARDEKILELVNLMGLATRRIERLVYIKDLDK